ncbi:sigma-70 family RNA polymerase sigma factor [Heyndrickxia coagulans]|uniref:sigma-70 family RNA polymerase sigma factor n=1 Tax=Heyndrickxia coagulans TaxID=1398 RepID=UPI0009B5E973|nr:sigma-70 family RNA polymerase sigma factor [Heyndrickxia coagulans]MDR4224267.1 sigma-70 family RNA polymerase sigma factor [Heyndrickxia coagulans DSM 1 = ATCC 7050]
MKDKKNEKLLAEAYQKGDLNTISKLNLAFQDFQRNVQFYRAVRYAIGILKIYSKDYDKRVNKRNNRNLLILDKPINNHDESSATPMVDLIQDSRQEEELFKILLQSNAFDFKNERLERAFFPLPYKQRRLLELKYVENYSQREISNIIGQTEKNIHYWHKKTIKQLQSQLSL